MRQTLAAIPHLPHPRRTRKRSAGERGGDGPGDPSMGKIRPLLVRRLFFGNPPSVAIVGKERHLHQDYDRAWNVDNDR